MVFHDFGSKVNLQQNGRRLNTPFMLITIVQVPPPYLIPSPRYLAKYIVQTSISLILGWYPRIFFLWIQFLSRHHQILVSCSCAHDRGAAHKLHTVVHSLLLLFQLHANLQARAEGTGVNPEGPPPHQAHVLQQGNMRACLLFTPCMCNFGLHHTY